MDAAMLKREVNWAMDMLRGIDAGRQREAQRILPALRMEPLVHWRERYPEQTRWKDGCKW